MTETRQANPLISVVLSIHDDAALASLASSAVSTLASTIESVIAQFYAHWELLVVSEDVDAPVREEVENIIHSFRDERIHYENLDEDLTRKSVSAIPGFDAKRRGIQRSRGQLLTFLEPGTSFELDHLARCARIFAESETPLDLVYSDSRIVYAGQAGEEDLLQRTISSPYKLLSAFLGEQAASQFKEELFFAHPISPLAGSPYTFRKPPWNSEAAKKLEQHCFIELPDAVLTRQAYEASGGLRKLSPLSWNLWRNMLRAGRDRFRHIPNIGVNYFVQDIAQFRRQYTLGRLATMDVPFFGNSPARPWQRARNRTAGLPRPLNVAIDRPARVLFIGEAIALSHVARPAVLAGHLHQKGYEVCFARDPRYSSLVNEDGLEVVPLRSIAASVVKDRLARQEPVHDAETLDRYVQEDLRVLRQFEPDIVVGDQRHSLSISGQLAGVPYVNIADAHWSPAIDVEYNLASSPVFGPIGLPFSNLLFQFVQPLAFAFQALPINIVRAKYGLPGINPDVRLCYTDGDYTVFPNDPALFTLKRPLPPEQTFIGPIPWSPSVDKPDWWETLPNDQPIVYVSLGSSGPSHQLSAVIQVLSQLPVAGIVAMGGRAKPVTLPGNIFTADFLPGGEAVSRASLVICNGGSMSGQQALSAGVPYLGLISNLDQMLFSTLVSRASACEFLREQEVNDSSLRAAILKMLGQERYRTAATRLAAGVAVLDACGRFEALIDSILHTQSGLHFRKKVRSA